MSTRLNCLLEYVCLCKVWHLYSSSTIYVVLFLDIYFWCEYMCVCMSMCTQCYYCHTLGIYMMLHMTYLLAVAVGFGLNLFLYC